MLEKLLCWFLEAEQIFKQIIDGIDNGTITNTQIAAKLSVITRMHMHLQGRKSMEYQHFVFLQNRMIQERHLMMLC